MGPTNFIQEDPNKKGSNLTMIRQKIMSGQPAPQNFTQFRGNIKNTSFNENNLIRQNNFSPTPSQIQRNNGFIHQYPSVHVEPKLHQQSPNKLNQSLYNRSIESKPMDNFSSFNFSQPSTVNKPLSQPTPQNPNTNSLNYSLSTNKDFETSQFLAMQSEKPKSNGVTMHIEDKRVSNLPNILSNPFDLISSNQIYRIVSSQERN